MTYENCKKIIESQNYEKASMLNKLDVFLLADRLTKTQYAELVEKINQTGQPNTK